MKASQWIAIGVLLLGASFVSAQDSTACKVNPTSHTATICTPQSRTSSIASPVEVVGVCTDSTPISVIQVYVNNQKVFQRTSNQIDVTIPMADGTNKISVGCKDAAGAFFSNSVYTAVMGGCTTSGGPGTLVACLPKMDSSVASPVHFVARDYDPKDQINGMRVVNSGTGAVLFQTCGRALDSWVKMAPGTYNFTVESLYTCTQTAPGSAEGVQVGPVTVY